MNEKNRYALIGAVGGAALGFVSMVAPSFIKPALRMPVSVIIFVTVGTAIMGALFGVMTFNSR